MVRTLLSAAVALGLCLGTTFAAETKKEEKTTKKTETTTTAKPAKGKKGHAVHGTVTKYDAATRTLTVSVKSKKETASKDFVLPENVKVVVLGDDTKAAGSQGVAALKAGAHVHVATDDAGKVTGVIVGERKKVKKTNK